MPRGSQRVRGQLPELPAARRQRLMTVYALSSADVVTLTQVAPGLDVYFEETVAAGADARVAKNWLLGVVRAKMNDQGFESAAPLRARMAPERLAELIALVDRGAISGSVAKDVFEKMFASGRAADDIVTADGLTQIGDASELSAFVEEVLKSNDDAVAVYRGGKTTTLGFLVGQVMKKAGGKANPKLVNDLLKRALEHESESDAAESGRAILKILRT